MAHVRKATIGSCPGFTWTEDGQVLEIPDHLALELVEIPGGGFSIVNPEAEAKAAEAPAPAEETSEESFSAEDVNEDTAKEAKARTARRTAKAE